MLNMGQIQGSWLLMGSPLTTGLESCMWAQALGTCLCSNHGGIAGVTATEDSRGSSWHPLPSVPS